MKRSHIIAATMALTTALCMGNAYANINSPDASGYLERGVVMYRQQNYTGCIDQLLQLRNLHPTARQEQTALYYMALASLHSADDEALELIDAFLIRYPESIYRNDITAAKGDYFFTRALYGDALTAYNSIDVSTLPSNREEETLYRMAYSHMMLGDWQQADNLFGRVAATNSPLAGAARFYRAYLSYSRGAYDEAEKMFSALDISQAPCCDAPAYMAQIAYRRGEFGKTLKLAQGMLERKGLSDRMRGELYRLAGESQYHLGNHAQARELLIAYENITDADLEPSAAYILGVLAYNDYDNAGAIKYLHHAIDGSNALTQSAYLYLGQAYARQGNIDASLMALENAFRRNNYNSDVTETAFYNYIVGRTRGGRTPFGSYVSAMEEFLQRHPQSKYADDIRANLVSGYMNGEDYIGALRILRGTPTLSEAMADAYGNVLLTLAANAYRKGNPAETLTYIEEADQNRKIPSIYIHNINLWRGLALYDTDRLEEAVNTLRRYITTSTSADPNRAMALYSLGYALFRQQKYDEAAAVLKQVANDQNFGADALNRIGDCLYANHHTSEAADYYSKALEANRTAGDYPLYQLAAIKGVERDYTSMIARLDDMMARYPSSPLIAEAMMDKADAYAALGKADRALEVYTDICSRYADSPNARLASLQTAITYRNMGKQQESVAAYRDVLRSYPTSDEARVAFEDLKSIYSEQGRLDEFARFVNTIPQAPRISESELDEAAFAHAEEAYRNSTSTKELIDYLQHYPQGQNAAQALYYLAYSAHERGNNSEAAAFATRLLENFPDHVVAEDALLLKASVLADMKQWAEAFNLYTRLEQRAATAALTRQAREGVMLTAWQLDLPDETLRAANALLASSASGTESERHAKSYKAAALNAKGHTGAAMEIWQELAVDPTDRRGAEAAVNLAEAQLVAQRADLAQATAQSLINSGTPHNYWLARGFIVLSDALRAQGLTFEADEYLKSLRNNYPGSETDIFTLINERLNP